jgi:hypothetical protein
MPGVKGRFFFWEGGNLHHLAINKKSVTNPIKTFGGGMVSYFKAKNIVEINKFRP